MEHKILPFTGSATALITPFSCDGRVDYTAFSRLIEFQIENGTDALVFLGTTGEASTLTDSEKLSVMAFAADTVSRRVPVILGTGTNDTAHSVRLTKEACRLGADAVLVVTPYYNKCSPAGLVSHYTAIAAASTLPLILYTVPGRTGVQIPLSVYRSLAGIHNIVAVKEASGSMEAVTDICAELGDRLAVYSGNDELTLPILALGGKGVISVAGNIVPRQMHELCRLFREGNLDEARCLQLRLHSLIKALFSDVNPIPVKCACSLMNLCRETMRLPLTPLSEEKRPALEAVLTEHGLI